MNNHVMPSRVQMEPNVLQQLVAEVKETVATGINVNETGKPSSFKAIDLWNIQRRGRHAGRAVHRKIRRQCGIVKSNLD